MDSSYQVPLLSSKEDYAYCKLKEMIISNQLTAGTLLVERSLSELLHISRTPVRAALTKLANEGFADYYPGRGMAITEIRLQDVIETYLLREVLDVLAIRLFMENASSIQKAELNETVASMAKALNEKDAKSFSESDRLFHNIYRCHCGNRRLEYMLGTLMDQVDRLMSLTKNDYERMRKSFEEHVQIVNAISVNQVTSAENAMFMHMSGLRAYHIKRLQEYVSSKTE